VDLDHNIGSQHLYVAMTDFLLNDCWPNRHQHIAAAARPASSVVIATLTGVLTSLMMLGQY